MCGLQVDWNFRVFGSNLHKVVLDFEFVMPFEYQIEDIKQHFNAVLSLVKS